MNDYFFTFGSGQPHYPGYVKVTAPDEFIARQLMTNEYGLKWSRDYDRLEDIHPDDAIPVDAIVYSEAAFDALRWPCDVCKTWRLDSKIDVAQEELTVGNCDARFNVKYCNDNAECKTGAATRINKLAEKFLGVIRET